MKLRTQLLSLSLATVLVPWFGWKLVQELEQFLRDGQESALLASAEVLSQALPREFQSTLVFGRDGILPVRMLQQRPIVDGYLGDWPEPASTQSFVSEDGLLSLDVLAGEWAGQLYMYCRIRDTSPVRKLPPASAGDTQGSPSDGLLVFTRSARGLAQFNIHTAAPGPLLISSQSEGGSQLEGYWQDREDGYDVEISLPPNARSFDVSLGALDISLDRFGQVVRREAGTLEGQRPQSWLSPSTPINALQTWMANVIPEGSRAWLVDSNRWVLAQTAAAPGVGDRKPTWAEKIIYRMVAANRTDLTAERASSVVRFDEPLVDSALAGDAAQHWGQDTENASVRHTVAVPINLNGEVRGALVMEAASDGLLLATNRALGRLLFITLLLTFGLAAGLWFFASRLSRRVQRLSSAVSEAMDDAVNPGELPLIEDRDELGELARNNARLLRSVTDYTGYLQKLAGRLSHELKTPLAITRSSLDNLGSQELNAEASQYLDRAREGLDRQTAIVRAMSEASRLEATVRSADWTRTDLATLVTHCVEGYRSMNPDRQISINVPDEPVNWRCAPDLLAQALDKLVDNALSLTGQAERIQVSLKVKGNYCHLAVQNSGTRLPETLRDHLFDSLVSMRDATDRNLHLGLGLYIVRLVAEAHDGSVNARDLGADDGVVFTISIPAG